MLRSKHVAPRGRLIITISFNYDVIEVLSFIIIGDARRTQAGIPYSSNYIDKFYNIAIIPFANHLVMYKFSAYVYEVDSHNKSKQSDLALEKFWVTHCG